MTPFYREHISDNIIHPANQTNYNYDQKHSAIYMDFTS